MFNPFAEANLGLRDKSKSVKNLIVNEVEKNNPFSLTIDERRALHGMAVVNNTTNDTISIEMTDPTERIEEMVSEAVENIYAQLL